MSNLWQEQVRRDRDPELEEINRMALLRVREMEQEIYEYTGLRLHTGIELEFYTEDANHDKKPLLSTDEYAQKISGQLRNPTFIRGSYIERFYLEYGKDSFEVVQGYVPAPDADIRDIHFHRSPSRQAEHMDRVRTHYMRPEVWKKQDLHSLSLSIKQGDLRKHTSAVQVNISAYTKDGRNAFACNRKQRRLPDNSSLMLLCADALMNFQRETLLLAAPYPDSYEQLEPIFPGGMEKKYALGRKTIHESGKVSIRLRGYYDREKEYKERFPNVPPEHFHYLENCLPRANGSVYLATLQTVAGVYVALMNHVKIVHDAGDLPIGYDVTKSAENLYIAHQYTRSPHMPERLGEYRHNHQIFANSLFVGDIIRAELQSKIASYFSPEAIKIRKEKHQSAGLA